MPKGRNELPIEQLPAWEWKARTASDSLKTHYLPWLLSIESLRYLRGPRVIAIAKKVMLWDFIVACVLSKLRGYNQLVYSGFDMNGSIASPIINSCGEYRLQKTCLQRGMNCCFGERHHNSEQQTLQAQLKDLERLKLDSEGERASWLAYPWSY